MFPQVMLAVSSELPPAEAARLQGYRRYTVTGPIESADVGGLDTLFAFAQSLQPHLDARAQPPEEVGALVKAGHRGLASGRGVYDWNKRDGAALLQARRAELFRWLKEDQKTKS